MIPPGALLIAKRLGAGLVSFVVNWWREVLIFLLLLLSAHYRGERDERDEIIQAMKDQQKLAQAQSEARGATTGQEAVETHVERTEADRPVVERVVERVRNVCLRPAADHRVPVPESARVPDGPASGAQDDEDRAFAEAVAEDLRTCQTELSKLQSLRDWVRNNGG